jgi:hypothetical protein
MMEGRIPQEVLPRIGTVDAPALFFDGRNLLLAYTIAPISGNGVAILKFWDIIHFECNPVNTRGLATHRYPASPWAFTEVVGSALTEEWQVLHPRFWTISFNDVTVEVLFSEMDIVDRNADGRHPPKALLSYISELGIHT